MFSADVLALAAFETLKICVPTIVDGWLGRVDSQICTQRLDSWSRALLEVAKVNVLTIGREHVQPGESYVVMSNHQSHFDIPVVFQALGIPLRMVAKKELFRIPVMGSAMRYSGFVEVDRARRTSAVRSLSAARERMMRDHTSVWIAPEGTRSKTGEVGKFKRGGFHLAVDAGLRILPVSVDGTLRILPSGGRQVYKNQTVNVIVRPPIDAPAYGRARTDELVATTREAILAGLPAARAT
ncbi:MAG TPA: lysophospholipid acyltransferase family protein [Polyangiaceae bacterium]|nr:lysophospholipid acyltransferase family protein [Polyangiaceae bacterium]